MGIYPKQYKPRRTTVISVCLSLHEEDVQLFVRGRDMVHSPYWMPTATGELCPRTMCAGLASLCPVMALLQTSNTSLRWGKEGWSPPLINMPTMFLVCSKQQVILSQAGGHYLQSMFCWWVNVGKSFPPPPNIIWGKTPCNGKRNCEQAMIQQLRSYLEFLL